MSDIIIVAPHNDDEIIGNYMVLTNKNNSNIIIIYDGDTPQERREEALKLKEYFTNVKMQLFQKSIPQPLLNTENTFYFPDPVYERHPLHRQWGFMGEQMARQGFDVVFYSTNMNAPYIHELKDSVAKKLALETIYPNQKDLWKYDHKYFLFEGKCKWLF